MIKQKIYKNKTNRFTIKGYLGLTGGGKTLSMIQNEVIPALAMGREVWSNVWLNYNGSNLHYFNDKDDLHNVKNALIVIDEIGDVYDPYLYLEFSKEDKNVFAFHRKRRNDIIYSSQDISQVFKVCRTKTHFFYLNEAGGGILVSLFYKLIFRSSVAVVRTMELGFSDLKLLALGLGSFNLNSKIESIDSPDSKDFSEITFDDDSRKVNLPKIKTKYYTDKDFLCSLLSDYRINLWGVFCSLCGDFVKLLDEKDITKINVLDYVCLAHDKFKEYLIIKPVPFYSSTEEIKIPEKDIIIKKYVKTTKEILVLQN